VAVIDVHSFGFTYERPAVRDVAFSVEPGEIFGFLGPSGAGKSTTQNILIRLLDGYEGSAVLGKDLRAWDRGYYRRIGVAFEAPKPLSEADRTGEPAALRGVARWRHRGSWRSPGGASDWNRTATSSSQSSRKACAAV
jgi:ABC-type branched-subunit amino acid transport system ATPase component